MTENWLSKTASEWIGGIKRFLHFPFSPETRPTEDYHFVNKYWTIESDSCDKLVVSVSAHASPLAGDVWIDTNRAQHIKVVTTNHTFTSTDLLIIFNTNAGDMHCVLPTASVPVNAYRELFVMNREGSGVVYIRDGNGGNVMASKTVGGLITATLAISTALETMHFFNDTQYWYDINAETT